MANLFDIDVTSRGGFLTFTAQTDGAELTAHQYTRDPRIVQMLELRVQEARRRQGIGSMLVRATLLTIKRDYSPPIEVADFPIINPHVIDMLAKIAGEQTVYYDFDPNGPKRAEVVTPRQAKQLILAREQAYEAIADYSYVPDSYDTGVYGRLALNTLDTSDWPEN